MSLAYAPHIVYTLALISVSTHLLWHRKAVDAQRSHLGAQITVLESLTGRLRGGERISQADIDRLKNLVRAQEAATPAPQTGSLLAEEVGWKDVFFGRTQPLESMSRSEEYDQKDWESRA
jgi:hypothetical protein